MSVTEALDRVLEILRTTELYSPQFGAKDEDPHANDLIGGLISVSARAGLWLEPLLLFAPPVVWSWAAARGSLHAMSQPRPPAASAEEGRQSAEPGLHFCLKVLQAIYLNKT